MSPLSLKTKTYLKLSLIGVFFLLIAFFSFFLFRYLNTPDTLNQEIKTFQKGGEQALSDLNSLPSVNLTEEGENYIVEDTLSEGIQITYPNQENKEEEKPKTKVSLPKDYTKPIEIKLDDQRIITIQDENNTGYTADTLSAEMTSDQLQISNQSLFSKIFPKKVESTQSYLRYQNDRKTLLYSYQRDRASGERKLKNWTFYQQGNGEEKESYKIDNAKIQKNENGDIELFFQTEQDLKNQAAAKEVDPSLMDRAMRTLEKEGVNQNQNPDLLIPKPYYYDKDGNYQEAEWEVQENKLILTIKTTPDKYPLSVDPTLSFTAPGASNGGDAISGTAVDYEFGVSMMTGDMNTDGKTDLIVGSWGGYGATTNRFVYIFYNDGSYVDTSNTADVIIQSTDGTDHFGAEIAVGDLNTDSRTDLIVGARNSNRAYIFYNDGSYPATQAGADVTITATHSIDLAIGDLNTDGRDDLVIGNSDDNTSTGKVYILYNDGSLPTNVASADVTITGEATSNYFGWSLATGDLNADGRTDLVVGGWGYSSSTGRAYIFYNDGSIPTTAATADVMITATGAGAFGNQIATGDLNADGKTDLVVGGDVYNSGWIYIFYNDGAYPGSASSADVTIENSPNATSRFGWSLNTADYNGDGRSDLAVGAAGYSSLTGRTYIFYNDGSYPAYGDNADVIITGEGGPGTFGGTLSSGDLNSDGKADLVVSASDYGSGANGKAYIFYSQNGVLNTNRNIVGEATNNYFGNALVSGDFNADGKVDLAVGSYGYSANIGRVYIFYNDGSIPTTAATADVVITGESGTNGFGWSLIAGDLNTDGKTDLVAGGYLYGSLSGRAYIFYNDGSIPTTAATADVTITGESSSLFGARLEIGDLNADGKVDLIVGGYYYTTNTGRAYIFYNDGSIPTTAATADVIITGETTSNYFGYALATGDLNADGKTDLVVGASEYSTQTGRAYIFYNDGSIPTTAATADVIIQGEGTSDSFGGSLAIGDLNADGKADLVVGAPIDGTNAGSVYLFYNDGSYPSSANGSDLHIDAESDSDFTGSVVAVSDINADGRADLIIGGYGYDSNKGRVYFLYNDGSYPTNVINADTLITGDATDDYFGSSLVMGDLNADGKIDLIVGAYGYSTNTGRIYFYEGQDNYSWTLQQQPLGATRVSPQVTGEEMRITGEAASDSFGYTLATGDLNADGKVDLVASAYVGASSAGRVYIFYNDGNYPAGAGNADAVITGESGSNFGTALITEDFNADGKADLAVGAWLYSSFAGRSYIFYSDGSIPAMASDADAIITGEASSNYFGYSFTKADFNADGKNDLVVGAYGYSTSAGRAYIFYNGSIITENASGADAMITGEASSQFGFSLTAGDLNADGEIDLAVGAYNYSSTAGRAYIFYNDGSLPTTGATADIIITGEAGSGLGIALTTGDFNADGEVDVVVGAYAYSSNAGRAYIFYNGSIITEAATGADVIITGEASSRLGVSFASGDLNTDGKTDLVVGGWLYSSSAGRAYIFYNDGSIPTTGATADVIITGESSSQLGVSSVVADFNVDGKIDLAIGAISYGSGKGRVYMYTFNDGVTTGGATGDYFGGFVTAGDLNADGKTDLVVGARSYSSSAGRAYIFYGGSAIDTSPSTADVTITGEASSSFGAYLVANTDFNADGKVDLAVGSWGYTTNTGRVYIFYNDGSIPTTAATADITITGAATSDYFGISLATGDMNADGKSDLVVGANGASKTYIYYNDGSVPTTAGTADVTITGGGSDAFGTALATGDVNADGKGDLIASALSYSTNGGAFVFYGDGSIPTTTGTADVTITGETGGGFGYYKSLATGDFNADGEIDLAVGAYGYSSSTGRVYIFYNDGSIPTTGATADVIISASTTGQSFGDTLTAGDLNTDGKTDLVVGSWDSSSLTDNVYVFYNDGTYPSLASSADKIFSGSTTGEDFGLAIAVADISIDGKPDLIIGAPVYSSSTGRVYTFITETVVTAVETKAAEFKGSSGVIKGSFELK